MAAAGALALMAGASFVLTDTASLAKEPDPPGVVVSPPPPVDATPYAEDPFERLVLRKHEGVSIRVYRTPNRQSTYCGGSGLCPPPQCFPAGGIVAGMSTEAAVVSGIAHFYDDPPIPVLATSAYFGTGEGAPVAWAIVQVAKATRARSVRVRFADGATDEMRPVHGVAVLVHRLPAERPLSANIGTADVLSRSGKVMVSRSLVVAPGPDFAYREMLGHQECAPRPPSLPEPNGPPPSDEQHASEGVVNAYTTVYNGSTSDDEKAGRIEDPRGVKLAFETARRNFTEALANVTVRIIEVKFLNPTEAAVAYDIVIPNNTIPEFPGRQGRAVLVDGTWKVAHATVCTDLQLAGASC